MHLFSLFRGSILIVLLGCSFSTLLGQVMISATGKPESLVICGSDGTFSLLVANTTGSTLSGATLLVDLPPGCLYSPGSISGASEQSIGNLNQPLFLLPDILNNTAHAVTYDAGLICGYANTENFNYTVTANGQPYTGFDTPLQNYYFPVLVINNITNGSASIPVGQTITRNITVEQQGLNAWTDTLIILDSHSADIQVLSTGIGTLHPYVGPGPVYTDTIIITGSDLPGGNNRFDYGESVVIPETVKLVGCSNGQSTIKATWGCNNQFCSFYSAFPSVSPASGSADIQMVLTGSRKDWAFVDDSGWIEFTVINSGSGYGIAFNLAILAGFSSGSGTYYPNANWVNEIDSFSVNNHYLPAFWNFASGALNGQYAYFTLLPFTFDPDGAGVGLEDADGDGLYDDLPAGHSFTMKAHTYYDWAEAASSFATRSTCGTSWTNSRWQAFRFGNRYQDQCYDLHGVNWIANGNLTPLHSYNTVTTLHTMPPDVYDWEIVWMEQTVSTTSSLSSQACPNDSVIYKVILPHGVIIGPGTATFKNVSMGTPANSGDTAIYHLDKSRVMSGGKFRVPIMVECESSPAPLGTISTRLQLWCDKFLHTDRYFTYWCSVSPIFGIQCPLGTCTDPYLSQFSVKRTTMGWTDNTLSTRVSPTASGIRLNNAMAGDSIRIEATGVLTGYYDSLYFRLQHEGMPGNWGNQLFFSLLADTLFFYNFENDQWDTCSGLSPVITNGSTSTLVAYFGNLNAPGNCLEGIVFTPKDSVRYVIHGRVRNVARGDWEIVPAFRCRFFWKNDGEEAFCNDKGVTFNVLGSNYPFVTSTDYQQILLEGCASFLYEGMIYRTLDACGGDANFPGEVRPYNVLDSMTFILPEGFTYQPGSSLHGYHTKTGSLVNQAIADPLIDVSALGTRLIYVRDSSWAYSAYYDCYQNRDRIRFYATPSCEAMGNYTYQMQATGRYQFYADGTGVPHSGSGSKTITYTSPLVELTRLITTAEGIEDTVAWEIRLCNQRPFAATNNWLGFENANEGITVLSVIDITNPGNPVTYPTSPYGTGKTWTAVGNLAGNECRNYLVKAIYSVCDYDSLLVRHGNNCAGLPVNPDLGYPPSGYICEENTTYVFLDPKDVSVNLSVTSPVNPVDLCDTLYYETVVTNTQLSYAFDLTLTVAVPPGLTVLPGGAVLKYPYTTGSWLPINDAVNDPPGSNKWVFHISSDPNGIDHLLGVDSIPKNGYRLRFGILTDCEFVSGRSLRISASGANACGEAQVRSSYTEPILITNIPTSVNLYVINTTSGTGCQTCSEPTPVKVKVINLGPSSVSTIEKLKISIDDAFDYQAGSLVNIHNGPSGFTNTTIAGIRYLDFAIEPNLAVNDSIVFLFQLEDIDPGSLQCDTIPLETNTLLVAMVYCQHAPGDSCLIHSITSTQISQKPVLKDHTAFGTYSASSIPNGISGETVTIHYTIQNTGSDTLHSDSLDVIFVYDANNNGLADETGADSLFFQTVPVAGLLPGAVTSFTASFPVPGEKMCRILASMRLSDNVCTCGDVAKPITTIHLINAGEDVEVCMQQNAQLGMAGITGYSYYWIPTLFLSGHTLPNPVFNYNTLLTQADTMDYILLTTRPGNCVTRDTTTIVVLPSAVVSAGADAVACIGYPHLLTDAWVINSNQVLWSTSGDGTFTDATSINAWYHPGTSDYATGSVTLSVFADGLCGDDADAMVLTFNEPASADAGADTTICASWNYTVTGASAANHTGLLWSTLGDGTFTNPTSLTPEYNPGSADSTAGSVQLILSATGLTSCPIARDTMWLTLAPPPVVTTSPAAKTICSEGSTGIGLTASQTGTTFTWTASLTSGSVTGFSDGSGDTIDQVLVNSGLIPGVVTYTVTPSNGGCTGLPFLFTVTVNPLPLITGASDTSFCSGGTTAFSLSATLPGTVFSWIATASSPTLSGFSNGSGSEISQTLLQTGTVPDTVFYTVTPETQGCPGPDSVFRAVVFPLPGVAVIPSFQQICSGDSTRILLSSAVTGVLFTWTATTTSVNLSGFSGGSGDTIAQQLVNSGSTVDTVIYTITASANGCTGTAQTIPVAVNPVPQITSSLLPQTICSADTVIIPLASGTPATTFSWDAFSTGNLTGFSSGAGDTICQVIGNTGYTIDTLFYLITPEINGCTGIPASAQAVVNPVPDLSNTPLNTGICNEAWINTPLTSHVEGATFQWSCSQLSGLVTGWSASSAPSVLLDQQLMNANTTPDSVLYHMIPEANGCPGVPTDFTVTVYPVPDVSFLPPAPVVCSGTATAIQCLSQVPASTFTWVSPVNPNVSGNKPGSGSLITDTLVNPGTVTETVSYIVTPEAFGCPPGITDTLEVLVHPIPVVTTTPATYALCNGSVSAIPLQGNLPYPTSYSWTSWATSAAISGYSNGSGSSIQQQLFNSGTVTDTVFYAVTPEANACEGDSSLFRIAVYPVPGVIITPPEDTICSGDSTHILLDSQVENTSFVWTASPGSYAISGQANGTGNLIRQCLTTVAFVPGSVTYSIACEANGCAGISNQVVVGVKPTPEVIQPVCFDTITTTNAQPILLRGGIPREGFYTGNGVLDSLVSDGSGGTTMVCFFNPSQAPTGTNTIHYYYTNRYGCTDSASITVLNSPFSILNCGDSLIDPRDSTRYPTVLIGMQCWMAANLNYGAQVLHQVMQRDNCFPEKYCYRNQAATCLASGALYQWNEIMTYRETEGVQGLCPPGWHLPTEAEWLGLFSNFVNNGFAGNALKVTGYSGFDVLLSGSRFHNKVWRFGPEEPVLNGAFIWSSTRHGEEKAWAHGFSLLLSDDEYTPSTSYYPAFRHNGFGVRCIRD